MERPQFPLAFEYFGRQHGAGKGQGNGQHQGGGPVQVKQQVQAGGKHHAGDSKVQQAAADHFRADDGAQLEFQANGKQQQQNTQVGDVSQHIGGLSGNAGVGGQAAEHKARGQVTDEWRQADAFNKQADNKGETDPDGFRHGAFF